MDLADIPFVRLRSSIPEPLRQGRESFSGVVAAAQHFLEPELIIDRQAQRIRAAWKEIQLPHKQLALLSLFAQRVKDGEERLPAPTRTCPIQHGRAVFSNSTASQVRGGELDDLERTEQAPRYGMDGDYFSSTKSKLHRALKTASGRCCRTLLHRRWRQPPTPLCSQVAAVSGTIRQTG